MHLVVAVLAVISLTPFVWLICATFKTSEDFFTYAFLPWRLSQLPHFQFQWGVFLCLLLLFLLRYLEAGRRRDLVLFGVFFGWNALANVHYALFSAFAVMAPKTPLPDGVGLRTHVAVVEPSIRPEVAHELLAQTWPDAPELPAPPVEWIEALAAIPSTPRRSA